MSAIPLDYREFLELSPSDVQALCDELIARPLNKNTIESWLADWASLGALFQECMARFDVVVDVHTDDESARKRQQDFRERYMPIGMKMSQQLGARMHEHRNLLPSELQQAQARRMITDNLNQSQTAQELLHKEYELMGRYNQITGAQTIEWDGETLPLRQAQRLLHLADRDQREKAWRMIQTRRQQDEAQISELWSQLVDRRIEQAEANDYDDYLSYRWAYLGRTDYTPDDLDHLWDWMHQHWTPLYQTLMAKRRDTLDMDSVRIWDVDIPLHQKPLQPFTDKDDLLSKTIELFRRIDEDFADYVKRLNVMGLIDLADRANTGSFGGFSRAIGRHGNFIFLNVHRTREDVVNLIHEIGHAVSIYASCQLPYMAFWGFPYDFSETPSSVMEILSLPHWDVFYGDDELPIASSLYFYDLLRFSLVDCIQGKLEHWVYQYPEQSRDMATCDAKLLEFVEQFWAGIDWTGFDGMTGIDWQGRAVYAPLHTMEYVYGRMAGLKLLSMPEDEAIQHYQSAIRLGNSVTTRELFDAMGLSFPIDEPTVIETVSILSGRL